MSELLGSSSELQTIGLPKVDKVATEGVTDDPFCAPGPLEKVRINREAQREMDKTNAGDPDSLEQLQKSYLAPGRLRLGTGSADFP